MTWIYIKIFFFFYRKKNKTKQKKGLSFWSPQFIFQQKTLVKKNVELEKANTSTLAQNPQYSLLQPLEHPDPTELKITARWECDEVH